MVVPDGARGKLDRVRKAAGLARWPKNGLRHSFASYRLAAIHDAPHVASELGHSTPQMLYTTYRELVRPEEAERYWQITPAAEGEKRSGVRQCVMCARDKRVPRARGIV